MKQITFFTLFFFSFFALSASERLVLEDVQSSLELSPFIESIGQHATENFSVDDVATKKLPLKKQVYWPYGVQRVLARIEVETAPNLFSSSWSLAINPSDPDAELFLYSLDTKKLISKYRLDSVPGSLFHFTLEPAKQYIIITKTDRSNDLSFTMAPTSQILQQFSMIKLGAGVYYGIMLLIFIYMLVIFFYGREFAHLYYILYIISIVSLMGMRDGLIPTDRYPTTAAMGAVIFVLLFTQAFFKLKESSPYLNWPIYLQVAGGLIVAMATVHPRYDEFMRPFEMSGDILLLTSSFYCLFCAIYSYKKNKKHAIYYLISWTGPLVAVTLYLFNIHFKDSHSAVINFYIPYIATGVQVLMLSFFFGSEVRALKSDYLLEKERASHVEKLRTLVRVVCHDISNPLTVITSFASFKARGEGADIAWDRVLKSSKKISEIIENVRELQAVESGKVELHLGPVSINQIFKSVSDTFEKRVEEKEQSLTIKVQSAGELFVFADKIALESSVLNNLVSNAIKFSTHGAKIELLATEDGQGFVMINVRDYGCGIPKNLQEFIFSADHATSRKGTDGEVGTGFGMPLVKATLERMKGTISFQSVSIDEQTYIKPSGTLFQIRLQKA